MNGYNLVELTLRDILFTINPLRQDWSVRFQVINELRAVVEPIESLRGATVEPFGSFVSNLFTRWGDLDISIELQNGSHISSMGKKQKQSILEDVLKALRKSGGYKRLRFFSNARVPILKFMASWDISCDISINNLSGQMKSKLLFWINEIDGRFRDLVLLVKEWAKAHHINDSKSGTFNSYSLSLLIVFHLQTAVPAILPPLREIYPENMVDNLTGVRAAAEKSIEDVCALNINRLKSDKSRLINRSSLSELFISFLAKLFDICSRASTHGISPHSGQSELIDSNMRWLPKTFALFVEDPFEQPANTARTVSSLQLTQILEAIQATQEMLFAPNQNQASLVSFLVGPHVLQSMTRMPISNPVIPQSVPRVVHVQNHVRSGPNLGPPHVLQSMTRMPISNPVTPQSVPRVVHVQNHVRSGPNLGPPRILQSRTRMPISNPAIPQSVPRIPVQNHIRSGPNQHPNQMPRPLQIQKQFQRLKLENEGETNGPAHASTSQRQQVKWKPRLEGKMDPTGSDG